MAVLWCRGVVQLFNAISKAQTAKRQADASGAKKRDAVKSTKAALLGALKPEAKPAGARLPFHSAATAPHADTRDHR